MLVSQGSRKDAQPAQGLQFESYEEEHGHLVAQKRRIESELAGYSKSAFSSEQARIRRENRQDRQESLRAWFSRKAIMENARQKLVGRKNDIEDEILRIKPLVKVEKRRLAAARNPAHEAGGSLDAFELIREDGTLSWSGLGSQILLELRAIRKLLEDTRGDG